MKRAIIAAAVLLLTLSTVSHAQERGPLALNVEFNWMMVGVLGGAGLGTLLWLTDPANPDSSLTASLATGAAWGTIVGAGVGFFILQRSALIPAQAALGRDPLSPRNRITADPIASLDQVNLPLGMRLPTGSSRGRGGPRIALPVLNLRF